MRDRQKWKVYAWETAWATWNKNVTKRYNLRRWIRRAERKYKVPPAAIGFLNRNRKARKDQVIQSGYEPDEHSIVLEWTDHNVPIALHEAAHAITDTLFGPDLEAHGELWMGIYLWLLRDAQVAPWVALRESAKTFGLKWAPVGKVAPRVVRKFYAGMIERAEDNA